jgi:hypothetical protein
MNFLPWIHPITTLRVIIQGIPAYTGRYGNVPVYFADS